MKHGSYRKKLKKKMKRQTLLKKSSKSGEDADQELIVSIADEDRRK